MANRIIQVGRITTAIRMKRIFRNVCILLVIALLPAHIDMHPTFLPFPDYLTGLTEKLLIGWIVNKEIDVCSCHISS